MRRLIRWDEQAALAANQLVQRNALLRPLVSSIGDSLAPIEVALAILLGLSGRPGAAVRSVLTVGAVYLTVAVAGALGGRARPFAAVAEVQPLLRHHPRRSFPSRHVASAVAMATVARPAHKHIGSLMALVAALLALVRVGAGLHYPSDVIAGAVLGRVVGRLFRRP